MMQSDSLGDQVLKALHAALAQLIWPHAEQVNADVALAQFESLALD